MDANMLAELIADHERFPAAIAPLFSGQRIELLRARPKEGKWSPLEILVHLRDEDVEDFWPRARAAAERRPIEKGIDPEGWVRARAYNEQDPEPVLDELMRTRADAIRWLRTLDVATLDHAIEHDVLGHMRCGDFVAAWRMHDLLHLRQLATTFAQLQGLRLDGWKTSYAGPIP